MVRAAQELCISFNDNISGCKHDQTYMNIIILRVFEKADQLKANRFQIKIQGQKHKLNVIYLDKESSDLYKI